MDFKIFESTHNFINVRDMVGQLLNKICAIKEETDIN